MSLPDLLIHRLTIYRRASTSDRLGQPHERWTTHLTDVPCRATNVLYTIQSGERNTERMRETYGVTHRVFLRAGIDVREDDEVRVQDVGGTDILPRTRIVLKRTPYDGTSPDSHHIELDCQSLRGPL